MEKTAKSRTEHNLNEETVFFNKLIHSADFGILLQNCIRTTLVNYLGAVWQDGSKVKIASHSPVR